MGTITNPTGSITTGSIQSADIFVAGAGSASAPSYSFSGDLNTGMYSPAADTLGWSAGGTLRWSVSTTAATLTLPLTVSDATQSTTTATGAIITAGGAGIAKNLNVGGAVTVTGDTLLGTTTAGTDTAKLDIVDSSTRCITMSDVITDATNKTANFSTRHYTNSEEGVSVIRGQSTSTENIITIGGGSGSLNAATEVRVTTASNNTTTTGTVRWKWDSGGSYVPNADNTYNLGGAALGVANVYISKTITAAATVGAQTIDKNAGSVNFAAAATSLVVTNSRVTANSIVVATIATNDSAMTSVQVVPTTGSFTIFANAPANAETRVNWLVVN